MAKFLTGNKLNTEVEEILEKADLQLILISPYIKLHERYISVLKSKISDPEFEIIVVFGKNEDDLSKSLKPEDLKFFTEFPNIEIRYEKRLHAKYYANESSALITSMNLYSYSQDNNIEAGILTKSSLLGNLTGGLLTSFTGGDSFEAEAFEYFGRVIQQADLLFKKIPEFESSLMGLKKKYKGSKITTIGHSQGSVLADKLGVLSINISLSGTIDINILLSELSSKHLTNIFVFLLFLFFFVSLSILYLFFLGNLYI
jgi:hypothetical protein